MEIRQKAPDSHISTATTAAVFPHPKNRKETTTGYILRLQDDTPKVTFLDCLTGLQGILGEAADEAGLTLISLKSPVPAPRVADDLRLLSDATMPLFAADKAQFLTDEGPVPINTAFRVTSEAIEKLLTLESETKSLEMILVVKKPDFLGDSMWEFRHEGKRIPAKVVDSDWLENFRHGAIAFRSGDALRGLVEIETNYGKDREILGTHYRILKVQEVIPRGG